MLNQLLQNLGINHTHRWGVLFAVALITSCTQREDMQGEDPNGRVSVHSVEVTKTLDWQTKSGEGASFVKLGDSLVMFAQVEAWDGADTATVVTRGTPIMNVNDFSDIRMNLYNNGVTAWTASDPVIQQMKISRSGKVYIVAPSYSWSSKTDKVSLLTYTPLPLATNGLTEGAKGNTVNYTVPTDVTKQPDFCATDAEMNMENTDGIKQVRALTLYHRLTAVGFAVNGWNVKVSKIEVSGVAFSGVYDLRNNLWTQNTTIGADTRSLGVSLNKVPTEYYNANPVWTDITRSNGYLMMVPQTLTDKAKVQITYTDAAGKEQVITALLAEMTSSRWFAGDKITYCIQLETAPSIGTDPITLYMPWKAGYTTTTSIPFVVKDPQDRYTFKWGEPWNIIHRGPAKVDNINGGAPSGWYTNTLLNTPIWFFTTQSNPSITSSRSSVVTLDAWRTVDRTFTVVQGMKPVVTVDGMPAAGYLVPQAGDTFTVTVKSNYAWESTVSNLTLNPSSGEANTSGQRVTVTIPQGDGSEGALSAIFKTTNDNKVPDLVASTTHQLNREINLKINPSTAGANVPGGGATYTVNLTTVSGVSWTTRPSAGVTVPPNGKGSGAVTIKVGVNPSKELHRDVKVEFLINGVVKATWNGTQLKFVDPPKVGSFYYSDDTYSSILDNTKTCIGIVCTVNPDGVTGRIISLVEIINIQWGPSTVDESPDVPSIISTTDGAKATKDLITARRNTPNFNTNYGVFAWIYSVLNNNDINGRWYLPAKDELSSITRSGPTINVSLSAVQATKINMNLYYRTSSQINTDIYSKKKSAWTITFFNGGALYEFAPKYGGYPTRAFSNF